MTNRSLKERTTMTRMQSIKPWKLRSGLLSLAILLIVSLTFISSARAQDNEGQQDLTDAARLKITAQSLMDLGRVIELCEQAIEKGLSPDSEVFCKQLLSATLSQRGLGIYELVFGSTPPDPRWPTLRDVALGDLEKSLELSPEQPDALLAVARLNQLPEGDEERASEALDQLMELGVDTPDMIGQIYMLRFLLQGDDNEAKLAVLNEGLEAYPENPDLLRARAAYYADNEEYEASLEDLKAAIKLDPNHIPTLQVLAGVLESLDRTEEALAVLEEASKQAPELVPIMLERARLLARAEKWEDALDLLNQVEQLDSSNITMLLIRTAINQELGNLEDALQDVNRVLSVIPEFEPALRLRVVLWAEQEEFARAMLDLKTILRVQERAGEVDSEIYLQIASLFAMQDKWEEAVAVFDEMLKETPDDPDALRGRGDAYLGLGREEDAIVDYERSLELDPENSGVLNNLSWLLSTSIKDEVRDGDRALKLAVKACEVTEYGEAHILSTLAAAHAELGNFEEARTWSAKAVELAEENADALREGIVESLREELESYERNEPWREEEPLGVEGESTEGIEEPDQGGKPGLPPRPDAGDGSLISV
jgi:tetratricopeptide (TPR) repeat protein